MDIEQNEVVEQDAPNNSFEKKQYIAVTVLLVLLAILITFVVTYAVLTTDYNGKLEDAKNEYEESLDLLGDFRTIAALYSALPKELQNIEMLEKLAYIDIYYRANYVGEINEDELIYGIANGYIAGTHDPYGGYYTADEFKAIMNDTAGNTVGIGVYVTSDGNMDAIRISYVMKDSPANQAGLLPGDVVTHVGGKSVSELGYYSAIELIKGEEGTDVTLTYVREGQSYTVTLKRAKVEVESVIYTKHETEADTGVVRIIEFNDATTEQFINAVKKAVGTDGCKKIVFDLRSNSGGTLGSVVAMLDFLLPAGELVTVRYADGTTTTHYSDDDGEELTKLYGSDIEMAVLVNGYTASAAELFTCALKDYGVAKIVGEKTFGKGCGQNVIPLKDGAGLIFTTFLYDPPVSENYNGVGIVPDVVAHLSEEASKKNLFELSHSEDDQLKAALEALK